MLWRQRMGLTSWADSRSSQSAAAGVPPGVDVGDDRDLGLVEGDGGQNLPEPVAGRAHERGVEGAADRHRTNLAGARARWPEPPARATAPGSPAITVSSALLKLATQTSPSASRQAMSTVSASQPRMTLITPGWASAAACMASPRSATTRTPSSNPMRPAGGQGAVLADGVAGDAGGLDAQPLDGVDDQQAEGEGGQLGVAGLGELVEGSVEQQAADVPAGGLGRVRDHLPRRVIGPGAAHPRPLGTLAGEDEGRHYGEPPGVGGRMGTEVSADKGSDPLGDQYVTAMLATPARMAEQADAMVSNTIVREGMRVRIPLRARDSETFRRSTRPRPGLDDTNAVHSHYLVTRVGPL